MSDMKEISAGNLFVFFVFGFIVVVRCCALWLHSVAAGVMGFRVWFDRFIGKDTGS
jgi:hypothetical protein